MSNKHPGDLANRFRGKNKRSILKDCLLMQDIVAGDDAFARAAVRTGKLVTYPKGKVITEQGANDNDIYLLLCGSVEVRVNGRLVAMRTAKTHFGEMALIDPTATRSATIVAAEQPVVAFRLTEPAFTKLSDRFPKVWKRIAAQLAVRLRERSKFHRAPNNIPEVFIGSSSEFQSVACSIKRSLQQRPVIPRIWQDDVFQASQTVIEDLLRLTSICDFAVLVLTPDDRVKSRGKIKSAPRDNVVYELGLFTGALGRDRSFIVMPENMDIKIPTDLLGVTVLRYPSNGTRDLTGQLRNVNRSIWSRIQKLGTR